jgi:ABC-type transport system involved in multi-copper enzyme maturation permease subunit
MFVALVRANLLELIRSRIYLAALAMLVMLAVMAALLDQLATGEEGRAVVDVGLWVGALSIDALAVVLGLSSSAGLQSVEVMLLLTRAVSREAVMLARFVAVAVVVVVAAVACGVVLLGLGAWVGSESVARIPAAVVLVAIEGVVVAALGFTAGVAMSSSAAAVTAVALIVVGRLGVVLLELADAGKFGAFGGFVYVVARVVPQLWRFDSGPSAGSDLGMNVLYGVCVLAGILGIGVVAYRRRELG